MEGAFIDRVISQFGFDGIVFLVQDEDGLEVIVPEV
jgi:hypothetical protein